MSPIQADEFGFGPILFHFSTTPLIILWFKKSASFLTPVVLKLLKQAKYQKTIHLLQGYGEIATK
jgi:hypothetical protein